MPEEVVEVTTFILDMEEQEAEEKLLHLDQQVPAEAEAETFMDMEDIHLEVRELQ